MSSAPTRDSDMSTPLPRRGPGATSDDTRWTFAPTVRQRTGDLVRVVEDALHDVSGKESNVSGLLLASADGLVLASDTHDVHLDTVAAMAAAAASIANQFTEQTEMGMAKASLFEGSSGHVAVFQVEPRVLLVVFGRKDTTLGLFNIAARNALFLLRQAIHHRWVRNTRQPGQSPAEDVNRPR